MDDLQKRIAALSPEQRKFFESKLKAKGLAQLVNLNPSTQIQPAPASDYYPLSPAQKRMYILHRLGERQTGYNISDAFLIEGTLDRSRLEKTFQTLITRHESLRTSFEMLDGEPVQKIHPQPDFKIIDLQCTEAQLTNLLDTFIQPFDLSKAPLLRVGLVKLSETKHLLIYDMPHIISDGRSMDILAREFLTLYSGATLPELRIQYKDFAQWQNEYLKSETVQAQEKYWLEKFSGEIPPLNLPLDHPRSPVMDFTGDSHEFETGPELTSSLKQLAAEQGATLFMLTTAAYNLLLSKITGQKEIVVGLPVEGRRQADLENMIGVFLNTVALRNYPRADRTFENFLAEVKDHSLKALENQDYQFETLLDQLEIKRDPGRNPLFDTIIDSLTPAAAQNIATELPGLKFTRYKFPRKTTTFDLTLYLHEAPDRIFLNCTYRTSLFKTATIKYIMDQFRRLLEEIAQNPGRRLKDYPIFDRKTLIPRENQVKPGVPYIDFPVSETSRSIIDRFEDQVRRSPQEPAVQSGKTTLTYEVLNKTANRIAHTLLQEEGFQESKTVALLFEHGADMITGMLGVLKTGKIYVPLDPTYPEERLVTILTDCGADVLLTNSRHYDRAARLGTGKTKALRIDTLSENLSEENPGLAIDPTQAAVILYTSGSTGKPKGVTHSHFNIVNYICRYTNELHINSSDRLALFTSYSHAVAVIDIFAALLNGAALSLYDIKQQNSLETLASWLREEGITIYHSVPVLYRTFINTLQPGETFPLIRMVILGGEAVGQKDLALFQKHFPPSSLFVNFFGATEVMVVSFYMLDQQTAFTKPVIPIGYPVQGIEALLINEDGQEAGVYGIGELVYRSQFLSLGYWNQPEKTEEAFQQNNFHHEGHEEHEDFKQLHDLHALHGKSGHSFFVIQNRIYRSGDLGRLLPDGTLEYLGRKDFQVKIRGYRVELSEVEAVLGSLEAIETCAVILVSGDAENYLAGYYRFKEGARLEEGEIRQALRQKLPDYMVPSYLEELVEMPLTPNGKIDRQRLPRPQARTLKKYVAPRNEAEWKLAEIWEKVLGIEKIGVEENFFELGGNSLKALQMIALLRNYNLELSGLFQYPTIAELSQHVKETAASALPLLDKEQEVPVPSATGAEVLEIKPFHEPWQNCYEDTVFSVLHWLGLGHELIFARSWNFEFLFDAEASTSIGRRFNYNRVSDEALLEQYYGLKITLHLQKTPAEILKIIEVELAAQRPALLGIDSYWNPWDLWYQSRHSNHVLLVVGINPSNRDLYCTDPYYSKQLAIIPSGHFENGALFCVSYSQREEIPAALDWREIVQTAVPELQKPMGTGPVNTFDAIRGFGDLIRDSFNPAKETEGIEESFNFWEIPIFNNIKQVSYGRYKFGKLIEYLGSRYQAGGLTKLAYNFKVMGTKWDEIRALLFKMLVSDSAVSLEQIRSKIWETAEYEEQTAALLLEVCRQTDSATKDRPETRVSSNELTAGEIVFVDLSSHFNNNGFHPELSGNCAADISGNGFYLVWENQSPGDQWEIGELKFRFPEPTGARNDNLICAGQQIPVPPGHYTQLMLLGNSEWGQLAGEMSLSYADGKTEPLIVEFSDWNLEPTGAEQVAWRGKAVEKGAQGPKLCNFSPRIFAQKVELGYDRVLESIRVPNNPCIHLYAISLEKNNSPLSVT